jgi:hypothetical protein
MPKIETGLNGRLLYQNIFLENLRLQTCVKQFIINKNCLMDNLKGKTRI